MGKVFYTVMEARAEVSAAWREAMKAAEYQRTTHEALTDARGYDKFEGMFSTVKQAMHRVWAAHEALEVATLREENAVLRVGSKQRDLDVAEANEAYTAVSIDLQRERNKVRQLNERLEEVEPLFDGGQELRDMVAPLEPPGNLIGVKGLWAWLIEQNAVLREVNAKRDTAHVPAPEVVAATQSIPGAVPLTVAPLDVWTLAYLHQWWECTTDDQHRADAFTVLTEAIQRRDKRGRVWDMIVMMVNKRIAPCQITAPVVVKLPTEGQSEATPAS